jgi:hypothetical protein
MSNSPSPPRPAFDLPHQQDSQSQAPAIKSKGRRRPGRGVAVEPVLACGNAGPAPDQAA